VDTTGVVFAYCASRFLAAFALPGGADLSPVCASTWASLPNRNLGLQATSPHIYYLGRLWSPAASCPTGQTFLTSSVARPPTSTEYSMGRSPQPRPRSQPTKFDLTINLKTAKAFGLTIPQSPL
jgi:hypothetical protein